MCSGKKKKKQNPVVEYLSPIIAVYGHTFAMVSIIPVHSITSVLISLV